MTSSRFYTQLVRLVVGLSVNTAIWLGLFHHQPGLWLGLLLSNSCWALLLLWPNAAMVERLQQAGTQTRYWQHFARHTQALLPLWSSHIALGKQQMDEAARQISYRFDDVLQQVDQQQGNLVSGAGNDALERTKSKLQHILDVLQYTTTQRAQLGLHLHGISDLAQQLKQASIRLGQLTPSEWISEQANLSQELALHGQLLQQLIHRATGNLHQVNHSEEHARLADNSTDESIYCIDEQEQLVAQTAVQDILLHLQFQDRVNQILSGVQNDMQRLEQLLSQALSTPQPLTTPPDTKTWLLTLKNSYTTYEQHALHRQQPSGQPPQQQNITFF